jgi:O-antigen/teichoic acid export membrane protein
MNQSMGGSARTRSSARAAVVIAGASAVLAVTGYLFNVAVIRFLGPGGYAEVAALLAVIGLVALPLGSVTSLVARETAFLLAGDRDDDVRASARWLLKWGLLGALAVGVLVTLISPVIAGALEIHSAWPVVMMGWGVAAATATAPLLGLAQGAQDFTAVGTVLGGFGILRVLLLVPALFAGWGTGGALGASLVASIAALAWTVWAVRALLIRPSLGRAIPDIEAGPALVLIAATLAFGSLTNIDVLFAGLLLPQQEAGNYAAAALFAKAALLIPASVAIVLLPRAASLGWLSAPFRRVAIKSLIATVLLTAGVAVVVALLPSGLLLLVLGSGFGEVRSLLPWFAPVMVLGAWVQVLLYLYLSQRRWSFPLLIITTAIAQIALFLAWHPSARAFVMVTGACLAVTLVIHEFAMPLGVARLLRRASAPNGS